MTGGSAAPSARGGSPAAAGAAAEVATVAALVAQGARRLAAAGVAEPAADARCLAQAALGVGRTRLVTDRARPVSPGEVAEFDRLIGRRLGREPVSRILGAREFWSLPIGLDPAVLDPRPDSETVVAAGLAALGRRAGPQRILDLGSGSGCLLLALLAERPSDRGIGVDASPAAVRRARATAAALGLADRAGFLVGDWGGGLAGGRFDLIVSNPPYVPTAEIAGLAPEVRAFDPPGALDGGPDGLASYRAILPDLRRLLAPGGVAVLEVGGGLAGEVARLLADGGFGSPTRRCDLGGRERCLVVEKAVGKMGGSG